MRIVAISDVHNRYHNLLIPKCDVLISAGDYSFHGEPHVVKAYHEWLHQQPADHIISGQGNHEVWVEKNFDEAKAIALAACPRVDFLEEGRVVIDGVNFWYASVTPWFCNWAYNRWRGPEIAAHWRKIPEDTNVLIAHGPPYGILDIVPYVNGVPKKRVGCHDLLARIKELPNLDINIFGHIHHSHGEHHEDGVSYYNVAVCDEQYVPSNGITVIDYIKDDE